MRFLLVVTCSSSSCTVGLPNGGVGFKDVARDIEQTLMPALGTCPCPSPSKQINFSFQFFSSRVHTASCGANVDHGVLALGYDIDAGSLTIVYPPDHARAHLVLDVGSGKKTVDRLFDCLKSSRHSKSKLVKHVVSVLDVVIDINSCTHTF